MHPCRIQRYASSNQRSYVKALNALHTIQNNRYVRGTFKATADGPIPELVDVIEVAARAHELEKEAKWAEWSAIDSYINAPA